MLQVGHVFLDTLYNMMLCFFLKSSQYWQEISLVLPTPCWWPVINCISCIMLEVRVDTKLFPVKLDCLCKVMENQYPDEQAKVQTIHMPRHVQCTHTCKCSHAPRHVRMYQDMYAPMHACTNACTHTPTKAPNMYTPRQRMHAPRQAHTQQRMVNIQGLVDK